MRSQARVTESPGSPAPYPRSFVSISARIVHSTWTEGKQWLVLTKGGLGHLLPEDVRDDPGHREDDCEEEQGQEVRQQEASDLPHGSKAAKAGEDGDGGGGH